MSELLHSGYCSWCLKFVSITPTFQYKFKRDKYTCPSCFRKLVICRAAGCTNYACWDKFKIGSKKISQRDQFCGEHKGVIANFPTLESTLSEPSEYLTVYANRCINLAKVSTIGLGIVGGVAIAGPLAAIAAPIVGGAIGGLMGYSGVVATNAGLAWLGGGSLAVGGFGMAGGMTVVTIAGTAVGGSLGGYVCKSYFGDINNFGIKKIRTGKYPAIVTINGFLSEKNQDNKDWESCLPEKYKNHAWFHVNWEAKTLSKLGNYCFKSGSKTALKKTLTKLASKATKKAAKKLAPGYVVLDIIGLATNPWHVALIKSEKTGVLLADILMRCVNKDFILFGHSLGARGIFSALQTLSRTNIQRIKDVHLFGGAVNCNNEFWGEAKKAVKGTIYNYHSNNDYVLRYMYRDGTFFSSKPIGNNRIENISGIKNIDVTSIVNGHMNYKTYIMKNYIE